MPRAEHLVATPALVPFLVVGTALRALAFPANAVERATPRHDYAGPLSNSLAAVLAEPEQEYAADWVLELVHSKEATLAVRGPLRVLQVLEQDVLPLPQVISSHGLYTAVIVLDGAPAVLVLEPRQTLARAAGSTRDTHTVSES
ncbi:MAG: hypothetical protein ACOY0T_00585 [Myxococcota bacterium]